MPSHTLNDKGDLAPNEHNSTNPLQHDYIAKVPCKIAKTSKSCDSKCFFHWKSCKNYQMTSTTQRVNALVWHVQQPLHSNPQPSTLRCSQKNISAMCHDTLIPSVQPMTLNNSTCSSPSLVVLSSAPQLVTNSNTSNTLTHLLCNKTSINPLTQQPSHPHASKLQNKVHKLSPSLEFVPFKLESLPRDYSLSIRVLLKEQRFKALLSTYSSC
ncbi:hypothetical protein C9374_002692 [Naegleria lovaniensis]|uniref:Uncharacterized protein n=1 Tax=Naegleria lovaniensis TaxID=51637 RepID=A0AA88KM97_NAELO|nr:uncharacterized protein C9374_002692 [Naegleria lovaniensis]KAG2386246.1 hypothetical protein C9374_002692 [Naegleria lovaniensis]